MAAKQWYCQQHQSAGFQGANLLNDGAESGQLNLQDNRHYNGSNLVWSQLALYTVLVAV